jgi:hypothetical protein
MGKVKLHLGKVPPDPAGRLRLVLDLYRRLTGKEPTPEGVEKAKATLRRNNKADRT